VQRQWAELVKRRGPRGARRLAQPPLLAEEHLQAPRDGARDHARRRLLLRAFLARCAAGVVVAAVGV